MDRYFALISLFAFLLLLAAGNAKNTDEAPFDQNYNPTYGFDRITVLDHGNEVQLRIDEYSGCGFHSKQIFGSGYFRMRMKLPDKDSTGIITTFYLTSNLANQPGNENHDELDFEFLGSDDGMNYTLSTNVFVNGQGNREQQFKLWFNPTIEFHTYEILWNQYQIVFFVDETPIRVFKNNTALGVDYPSKFMEIQASVWNSTQWLGPVDWSEEPFTVHYQGFNIAACNYQSSNPDECYSNNYFWNRKEYRHLSPDEQKKYETVRNSYMFYDYCDNSSTNMPECQANK